MSVCTVTFVTNQWVEYVEKVEDFIKSVVFIYFLFLFKSKYSP